MVEFLGSLLVFFGAVIALVASVGAQRLHGFFERVHVYGVIDSLVVVLVMSGMAASYAFSILTLKCLLIMAVMLFTSAAVTSLSAHIAASFWENIKCIIDKGCQK